MTSAARLVPENGGLYIDVNVDQSPGKQNFSVDHEIAHTLLPTYTGQAVDDPLTGQFPADHEEELLCDFGAAALLLDPRWLRPLALEAGPSLTALVDLASRFGASLEATALQITGLGVWPCAIVFWEEGFRKRERVPAGQPMMHGLEDFGPPRPKLRVKRPYVSAALAAVQWIPPNKSIADTSLVVECGTTGQPTCGIEAFDFGRGSVRLYCESMSVPYRSGASIHRRVISLLLPADSPVSDASVTTSYQMEIL